MDTTFTAAEITRIEDALDALLTTAIEADRARRTARSIGATTLTWHTGQKIPTRKESAVEELLVMPVGAACRHAIRALGERLFQLTRSLDDMHDVLERVADRDPKHYGRRAEILNHRWDGIGEGQVRWWA